MLVSQKVLDTFISMHRYCRDDLRHIHPGWGYVGPIIRGRLTVSSVDMPINSFSNSDKITQTDLEKSHNWINIENPGKCGILALNDKMPNNHGRRVYFPAWIPSDFKKLLTTCNKMIDTTPYDITEVIMEKSITNIGEVTIGFKLDDKVRCVGTGSSFLSSGLEFYKKTWEVNYEYHRPSISNIDSEVYITNSYNEEPTLEFENAWDYRREVLNNASFYKYGDLVEHDSTHNMFSKPYLGTLTFMEGTFHLIWKNGPYRERLLL